MQTRLHVHQRREQARRIDHDRRRIGMGNAAPRLGTTNRSSYLRGSHRHTAVVSRSARITDREVVSPVGRASVTRTRSPGRGISTCPTASQFLLNLVTATDPGPVVPRDTFTCNDRRESPSSDSTVPSRWVPQSAAQSGVDFCQNAGQNGMHGQYRHVSADGLAASANGRLTWRRYSSSFFVDDPGGLCERHVRAT